MSESRPISSPVSPRAVARTTNRQANESAPACSSVAARFARVWSLKLFSTSNHVSGEHVGGSEQISSEAMGFGDAEISDDFIA
jgi:hypothetical protein